MQQESLDAMRCLNQWTSLETTLHMKLYIFAHNMSCRETHKGDWTMSWNFAHQPICITPPSTLPVLPFLPPVLLPALLPTSPPSLPDKNGSASSCQNHWPFTNFLFRIRCVWVCESVCVCVKRVMSFWVVKMSTSTLELASAFASCFAAFRCFSSK